MLPHGYQFRKKLFLITLALLYAAKMAYEALTSSYLHLEMGQMAIVFTFVYWFSLKRIKTTKE